LADVFGGVGVGEATGDAQGGDAGQADGDLTGVGAGEGGGEGEFEAERASVANTERKGLVKSDLRINVKAISIIDIDSKMCVVPIVYNKSVGSDICGMGVVISDDLSRTKVCA
jgi:hypothetical protein